MKYFLKILRRRNSRGFTVIEAFVGISILLIGLVGPLMLVNSNLQAGRFSRDQITAYYLAQEAIEMVREKRDENFIASSSDWLAGLGDCTSGRCYVDGRNGASDPFGGCSGNCTFPLQVNTASGQYGYDGGFTNSHFYRYVEINENVAGDGALVTVVVGFDTGRYVQEYTTTDYLRDWNPR
jgi:Tfp pilus assembly protein PilV